MVFYKKTKVEFMHSCHDFDCNSCRISPCQGLPVPEDEAATKGAGHRWSTSSGSHLHENPKFPNRTSPKCISLKWIMNQHVFFTLKLVGYFLGHIPLLPESQGFRDGMEGERHLSGERTGRGRGRS